MYFFCVWEIFSSFVSDSPFKIDGYKSLCNACGIHYAKIVKREETQMQTYVPKGPIKMDQLVNNNSSSTNQDNNSSSDAAVTIKGPFSIYPAVASPPLARSMQRDGNQFLFVLLLM